MNTSTTKFDASEETVAYAAEYCARALAKWFGSEEEAIKAITQDPQAMVAIAIEDFIKTQRKLADLALTKSHRFAIRVLAEAQQ